MNGMEKQNNFESEPFFIPGFIPFIPVNNADFKGIEIASLGLPFAMTRYLYSASRPETASGVAAPERGVSRSLTAFARDAGNAGKSQNTGV